MSKVDRHGEGITVIASQAPPLEIPLPSHQPLHSAGQTGGGGGGGQKRGVRCLPVIGLWLLRLCDALLYAALFCLQL